MPTEDERDFWATRRVLLQDDDQLTDVKLLRPWRNKCEPWGGFKGSHYWRRFWQDGEIEIIWPRFKSPLTWRQATLILLHEYGHHVQWRTGFITESDDPIFDSIRNGRSVYSQRMLTIEQDAWEKAFNLLEPATGVPPLEADYEFMVDCLFSYHRAQDWRNLLTRPYEPDRI